MFTSQLLVHIPTSGRMAVLLEPLYYRSDKYVAGPLVVPKGFYTDFASVPRVLWPILPPMGSYSYAAVLHDWLYMANPLGMTREEVDGVFLESMVHLGVSWYVRTALYAGVRVGGWLPWNNYRRNASVH